MTYREVHDQLWKERGPASDQVCITCGGPAHDWAYQYNGDPEHPRTPEHGPYSEDIFNCYRPMCVSCHRKYDFETDQWLKALYKEVGERLGKEQAERFKTDPEFAQKRRELGRAVGLLPATEASLLSLEKARAAQTPEMKKRQGEHMGRVHAERLRSDPDYAEQHREYSRRNARARRECSECSLVSNPVGLASHQRSTGHVGYTDL